MSDYLVWGTKGSGKSLVASIFAEQRAKRGLKVVSNVHFFLERFDDFNPDSQFLLLPQVPSHLNLSDDSIGLGYESSIGVYTDEYSGLIILDEVSNILQAREWQGAARASLIEVIIHLRKKMYETIYIAHGIDVLDAQVRKYHIDKTIRVTSLKNRFSYARKWMPDMHTLIFYDGGSSASSKPIMKRTIFFPVHFQKLYQTTQVFSLMDDVLSLDFSFPIEYDSPFLIQDRNTQNSGSLLVDMRVVREMIPPQYSDMFPARPPHLNANTPFRYAMGFLFLFLSIFWKPLSFLVGGIFLYLMFSPVVYNLTDSITGKPQEVKPQEVGQEESAVVDELILDKANKADKGNTEQKYCDIFSERTDFGNSDFILDYFKKYQFSIGSIFSQLGRPSYIIVFYDDSDSPVAQFSSFELGYMGWESYFFNKGRAIAIYSESLRITYLYFIQEVNFNSGGFKSISSK